MPRFRFERANDGKWVLNNPRGDEFRLRLCVMTERRTEGVVVNFIVGPFNLAIGWPSHTQDVPGGGDESK